MNVKWKIAIHIAVTLLIGILIGALLNRTLVQRRIRNMLEMRAAGLLAPRPEKDLKPLTPEQDKQIRDILDKHAQRLAEIHQRFDREIQSAFSALSKEIDPILTPEQRDQLKRMIPGPPPFPIRPRRGFPPMGGPELPPFEMERLRDELNLSEEQMKKIKGIFEEFRNQAPRLGEKPPGGAIDQLQRNREMMDLEIEKVLTEEQKEKFRTFKERRGPLPRKQGHLGRLPRPE